MPIQQAQPVLLHDGRQQYKACLPHSLRASMLRHVVVGVYWQSVGSWGVLLGHRADVIAARPTAHVSVLQQGNRTQGEKTRESQRWARWLSLVVLAL